MFFFNFGVYYFVLFNFIIYRCFIDNVVKFVKKKLDNIMENMFILIWKMIIFIEKEMVYKMYVELFRNKIYWRFYMY